MEISIAGADEPAVTMTYDDFYYMRDSIHAALEEGDFGSRFPVFMGRFEPDEWKVQELGLLERELETIVEAFKRLPPRPFDHHWTGRTARSPGRHASLYDVFVDAGGEPVLGRLVNLCRRAREVKQPIHLR